MRDLLENLRAAPTPLFLNSRAAIIKGVKTVHLAILKHALRLPDETESARYVPFLRRYALWLEDLAFENSLSLEESTDEDDRDTLFSSAAALYELTASSPLQVGSGSIFEPPLNDYLRCAVLASFTPYQARSSMIGCRIRDFLEGARRSSESPVPQVHVTVASIIAALVARQFRDSTTLASRLDDMQSPALAWLKSVDATNQQLLELDLALAIGRVCGRAALGMLIGIQPLLSRALERLAQIKGSAMRVDDSNHYWLADRLEHLILNMSTSSMHSILSEANVSHAYRYSLAKDQYFELWGPQMRAISQGLLDPNSTAHFVVSIPTGAGKTLFAELSLLTAVEAHENSWAVYVAPSRALVNQVSGDLRHRLAPCGISVRTVLAGAEQSSLLGEELEGLLSAKSVTVTTPERLDAYFRNAPELFGSCRLVVFDEIHKVADVERGPLLESLVARFMSLQPQTRILFLSGVMSNVDEIRSWLGKDGTIAITERQRPTRRVYGVAVRGREERGNPVTNSTSGVVSRRVDFSAGLIMVHEREDLEGIALIDLPDVFQGFYRERWSSQYPPARQWREDRNSMRSSVNDHAISLTKVILRAPGTVLVFMQKIGFVERACRELTYSDRMYPTERSRLASFIAAELGTDHPLSGYCLNGVAYHHARLPQSVQRAIELGLDQGWLKVVFATATLREGMNTTATTVVLAGHSLFDVGRQRNVDMVEADFLNLAGRAGRPRTDSEGRVFLVPDSLVQSTAIEDGKKYILADDAVLRVKSQLVELASAVMRAGISFTALTPMHQRVLLTLEAAQLTGAPGVSTFINHCLWSLQEEDGELTRATARSVAHLIERARQETGAENLEMASRLGLSLSSSERLRLFLMERADTFRVGAQTDNWPIDQIGSLIAASIQLPEIRKGELGRNVPPQSHLVPLLRWIRGGSYADLLMSSREANVLSRRDSVTEAVKYASDMSTWLSWSFGAAYSLLKRSMDDVDPYFGTLPLLVRYGVPTTAAAYICLLGISDRAAAQVLARHFEEIGQPLSLHAVSEWLTSLKRRDIERILIAENHGLRVDLVARQLFHGRSDAEPYQITRLKAFTDIPAGTIMSTRLAPEGLSVVSDGVTMGIFEDERELFAYPRDVRLRLIVVALAAISKSSTGAVAVVEPANV